MRAKELAKNRDDKLKAIKNELARENEYLKELGRASPEKASSRVSQKIKGLKCQDWVSVTKVNLSYKAGHSQTIAVAVR